MNCSGVELVALGPPRGGTLRWLCAELMHRLARPVWVDPCARKIETAFDPARRQYGALELLELLADPPPPAGLKRLGITHVDLFLPVFTHVLGAAAVGGACAVISAHRLADPDRRGDLPVMRQRLLKLALHELGHCAGLIHCRNSWCTMAPSRCAEEVDLKQAEYCPKCARRLEVP